VTSVPKEEGKEVAKELDDRLDITNVEKPKKRSKTTSMERKLQRRRVRDIMRLDKGSALQKEEVSERRKIKSSLLDDLLSEQVKERDRILLKKEEMLVEIEKKPRVRKHESSERRHRTTTSSKTVISKTLLKNESVKKQ